MPRIEKNVKISPGRSVSSLCDCSERIKHCHSEDLFDQSPFLFIRETFSHASNNARKSFVHRYQLLSIARYSFTRLRGLRPSRVNELIMTMFRKERVGFASWFSQLKIQCSGYSDAPPRTARTSSDSGIQRTAMINNRWRW